MQNYETSGLKVPGKTCKNYHKKRTMVTYANEENGPILPYDENGKKRHNVAKMTS
jgi:hypothetical protein